jgi:hypothetical protein
MDNLGSFYDLWSFSLSVRTMIFHIMQKMPSFVPHIHLNYAAGISDEGRKI